MVWLVGCKTDVCMCVCEMERERTLSWVLWASAHATPYRRVTEGYQEDIHACCSVDIRVWSRDWTAALKARRVEPAELVIWIPMGQGENAPGVAGSLSVELESFHALP